MLRRRISSQGWISESAEPRGSIETKPAFSRFDASSTACTQGEAGPWVPASETPRSRVAGRGGIRHM